MRDELACHPQLEALLSFVVLLRFLRLLSLCPPDQMEGMVDVLREGCCVRPGCNKTASYGFPGEVRMHFAGIPPLPGAAPRTLNTEERLLFRRFNFFSHNSWRAFGSQDDCSI